MKKDTTLLSRYNFGDKVLFKATEKGKALLAIVFGIRFTDTRIYYDLDLQQKLMGMIPRKKRNVGAALIHDSV